MSIPQRVAERRAELTKARKIRVEHIEKWRAVISESAAEVVAFDAELAGLDLADAAYAEHIEQVYDEWMRTVCDPKPARAPRRDIRGLVLDAVRAMPAKPTVAEIAVLIEAEPRQVMNALTHWHGTGDLGRDGNMVAWVRSAADPDGGAARDGPAPQQLDQAAE